MNWVWKAWIPLRHLIPTVEQFTLDTGRGCRRYFTMCRQTNPKALSDGSGRSEGLGQRSKCCANRSVSCPGRRQLSQRSKERSLIYTIAESSDLIGSESNTQLCRVKHASSAAWSGRGRERHSFGRKASVTLSILYIFTLYES